MGTISESKNAPEQSEPRPYRATSDNEDVDQLESEIRALADRVVMTTAAELDRVAQRAGQRMSELRRAREAILQGIDNQAAARRAALEAGHADPGPWEPGEEDGPVIFRLFAKIMGLDGGGDPADGDDLKPRGFVNTGEAAAALETVPPPVIQRSASPSVEAPALEELTEEQLNDQTARIGPSEDFELADQTDLKNTLAGAAGYVSGPELPTPIASIMKAGGDAEDNRSPEEHLRLAEQYLREHPDDADAYCRLASVQLELGMRAQGMINYLRAAEGFAKHEDLEKTMQIYNLLVMMNPEDYNLHEQMVMIALRLKNQNEAIEKLKWLVNGHLESSGLNEAIKSIDRVLAVATENVEIISLKAELLASCDQIEDACKHLAHYVGELLAENNLSAAHQLIEKGVSIAPGEKVWNSLRNDIEEEMRQSGVQPAIEDDDDDENSMGDWIPDVED